MTNFERFITENPEHPTVVRLLGISNRMTLNGNFGAVFSEVCKLADNEYGREMPMPAINL